MKSVDTKNLAQALFDTTFGKSPDESKKALSEFAKYLAKKNLLSHVDKITFEYEKIYNEKNNIIEATVTLLNRLSEKDKKELNESLKKRYKASEVKILEKVDKRILGGMKIKIGDTVFDNSLQNSLYQLETNLLK